MCDMILRQKPRAQQVQPTRKDRKRNASLTIPNGWKDIAIELKKPSKRKSTHDPDI